MRARPIRAAHGKAQEPRGQQRLQRYETGDEDPPGPRQLEILDRASHGWTDREIAAEFGLSYWTIQWHWRQLFDRLECRYRHSARCTRAQAVAVAIRKGYID